MAHVLVYYTLLVVIIICIMFVTDSETDLENIGERCKAQWIWVHKRIALYKSCLLLLLFIKSGFGIIQLSPAAHTSVTERLSTHSLVQVRLGDPLVLCREYSTLTVVCYGKSSSKLHGKQQILYQPVLIQTATTRKRWDKKKKKKNTSVSSATAFFLTIFPAARALHTARTRVTLQAHRVTEYLRHGGDSPT